MTDETKGASRAGPVQPDRTSGAAPDRLHQDAPKVTFHPVPPPPEPTHRIVREPKHEDEEPKEKPSCTCEPAEAAPGQGFHVNVFDVPPASDVSVSVSGDKALHATADEDGHAVVSIPDGHSYTDGAKVDVRVDKKSVATCELTVLSNE